MIVAEHLWRSRLWLTLFSTISIPLADLRCSSGRVTTWSLALFDSEIVWTLLFWKRLWAVCHSAILYFPTSLSGVWVNLINCVTPNRNWLSVLQSRHTLRWEACIKCDKWKHQKPHSCMNYHFAESGLSLISNLPRMNLDQSKTNYM